MKSIIPGTLILLLIVGCLLTVSACTGNQAEELFKTAQFEELQKNREHAQQLYEDILKKYPQSEYAKKAETRLSELSKLSGGTERRRE
jgi:outer membrane protein assembly factor BamD (BamD/ComL family)